MKCENFTEHPNGDVVICVKTRGEKEDRYIEDSWGQHLGCEARKRFNDADPVWIIRITDTKLKMRARLTFQ